MHFMKQHLQRFLLTLSFGLLATAANASSITPQAGADYRVLDKPQATDAGKKIEVIEFFAYFCPHCFAFEPHLHEWVKKQGANISFKRIHVDFNNFTSHQKLFYTLEAMGRLDDIHIKAFTSFHVERQRLLTDADVLAFVVKNGIDKQKFSDIYNSFSMQAKLSRGSQLQNTFKVDGVPTVVIDGRFITSPSDVSKGLGRVPEQVQFEETLKVMDWLVAKAQKEKK
jgi:protein dithiol oxidoreductase (disulfide-forming)